jgi:hypothetical protein
MDIFIYRSLGSGLCQKYYKKNRVWGIFFLKKAFYLVRKKILENIPQI